MKRGSFITLEGIDGAGKSTHLAWIEGFLKSRGREVRVTREPGGTPLGESLRSLLLDHTRAMHRDTETLLMFAARREHLDKVIRPALDAGVWVVSDRFTDASFAYQGGGRGVDWKRLETLETWVQDALQPDLTLLFDVPVEVGRKRMEGVREFDRFEREEEAFFARVRQAYLRRAREHPVRIHVIDSTYNVAEIQKKLEVIISSYC